MSLQHPKSPGRHSKNDLESGPFRVCRELGFWLYGILPGRFLGAPFRALAFHQLPGHCNADRGWRLVSVCLTDNESFGWRYLTVEGSTGKYRFWSRG